LWGAGLGFEFIIVLELGNGIVRGLGAVYLMYGKLAEAGFVGLWVRWRIDWEHLIRLVCVACGLVRLLYLEHPKGGLCV